MADLPTNLKDDILNSSVNTRRKYRMIENGDGTYSFEDVTEYNQVGDEYGAGLINETNRQVNARVEKAVVVRDLETIGAITQPGFIPDALALKDVNDSLGGLQFGIDENGNYGYIKAGADSVTPFKSGVTLIDSDLYTSKTHALKSGKYLFDCCMFSSYATLSHFDLTIDGTTINVEDSIGSEYTSTNGTLKLLSAKSNSKSMAGYGSVSVLVELNLNTDANVGVSYTASNNPGGMAISVFEN